jgi:hypothetical protein
MHDVIGHQDTGSAERMTTTIVLMMLFIIVGLDVNGRQPARPRRHHATSEVAL